MIIDDTIVSVLLLTLSAVGTIIAELLRRILGKMGKLIVHLEHVETVIALCPNCPKGKS